MILALLILNCKLFSQTLIKDCNNKAMSSNPYYLGTMPNGILFFAEDDTCGREIWFSDGTTAKTYRLVDANPGINGCGFNYPFVDTNRTFLFITVGNNQIWTTDGTPKGTIKLMDIISYPPYVNNNMAIKYHNKYYMMARDSFGNDLLVSDGTVAGTKGLIDLGPGNFTPTSFLIHKDLMYFVVPTANNSYNYNLYKSDGTEIGTRFVRNFGGLYNLLLSDDNYIYFNGQSNGTVPGLFRYKPETNMIDTLYLDPDDRIQSELFIFENKIYFNTYKDGVSKAWYNEGTPGVNKLLTLSDTSIHSFRLLSVKAFPDVTLGVLLTDQYGYEYWKMENQGTSAKFILDISPGNTSSISSDNYFIHKNGKIYFSAINSQLGMGIWSYDVTSESIMSYFNVPNPFVINQLFSYKDRTYMMAFLDKAHGNEFYALDDSNVSLNPVQSSELKVYPNPISPGTVLSIENISSSANIRLYDLSGRALELQNADSKFLIPETMAPGLYQLVIQDDLKTFSIKIQIL